MNFSNVVAQRLVEVKPIQIEKPEASERRVPMFNVVLWNDPEVLMDFVVKVLTECVGLTTTTSTIVMLAAHSEGKALVITEPYEAAEYHYEQLTWFGLTITIEPAD